MELVELPAEAETPVGGLGAVGVAETQPSAAALMSPALPAPSTAATLYQ